MSKFEVVVLLVGDVGCKKLNFIDKYLENYSKSYTISRGTNGEYVCEDANHLIYLHNIDDAENCYIYSEVDVIVLAYNSDKPETFRSLQRIWQPHLVGESRVAAGHYVVVDNSSKQVDNKVQTTSVSEERAKRLDFPYPLRYTTCVSEYKEVFSILEDILNQKSTQNQSVSDECSSNAFSENPQDSNRYSPYEIIPEDCSELELRGRGWKLIKLSENDCSTVQLNKNSGPTIQLAPNECCIADLNPNEDSTVKLNIISRPTVELSPNEYSTTFPNDLFTFEMGPKKLHTSELTPSDCSTEELKTRICDEVESISSYCSTVEMTPKNHSAVESSPNKLYTFDLSPSDYYTEESNSKMHNEVESIASDCSTAEIIPKHYSTIQLSPNETFTAEANPDERFERSPGKHSLDECSSNHSPRFSPDTWNPVISSPEGKFFPDISSDESYEDELASNKCPPIDSSTTCPINAAQHLLRYKCPNKYSAALSPKEYTTESIPIDFSTLKVSLTKFNTSESIPSGFSTKELDPKKLDELQRILCSAVEITLKNNSTAEFGANKCSATETNSDEGLPLERSPNKLSPLMFGSGECTPEPPVIPDECSSAISTPDAEFSPADSSSDDSL